MIIHIVERGDTLFSISRRYGVPQSIIAQDNGLMFSERLVTGQSLAIQQPTLLHTVTENETLLQIANRYSVTLDTLFRYNLILGGRDIIFPDQTLIIRAQNDYIGNFQTGGYAYPTINERLLNTTLPFMTYLMPFTYGFYENGDLVPLDDDSLIRAERIYGTLPFMHLSTLTENGNFSNRLSNIVFNSPSVRENLISNIEQTLQEKGYRGLDVDFEFVLYEDREKYSEFIAELSSRLNPKGYEVFVAVPPKTSTNQQGALYAGVDYKTLGQAANAVLLMTYEWGYTYGPPMAVSPVDKIRRVLDFAITEIPREKIFMGLSNYGYDWILPFVSGQSRAQSISTAEALRIALENGTEILYDDIAQSPYFFYTREGLLHEVWFEDSRSILAKLSLISEYGFRGGLYWNLMRENPQNLITLNSYVQIKREG